MFLKGVLTEMRVDVNVNVTYTKFMNALGNVIDQPKWGVQAFADLFDVTPRAVRFYEDKGLVTPRREGGSRVFGPVEYVRFERILRAKRLGFSLDDIKVVLDVTDGNVKDRVELLQRRENFKTVIESLSRRRLDINKLTEEMADLCAQIDTYLDAAQPHENGLAFAADYEAAFREHFADEVAADMSLNKNIV